MPKTVIISEDVGNQIRHLLDENRESKNINLARRYCISKGYSQEQAQQTIDGIRHDMPNSRLADCKFLVGVTRMFLDGQLNDAEIIMNFNKTLRYIASNAHVNEYDYNLNNLSADELIKRFSTIITSDVAQEKEQSLNRTYTQNDEYTIVKVPNFDTASEYGDYVDWCVTQDEDAYNSYTHNGFGLFYFCLRNGFEDEPRQEGEGCPLDSYGLSMIAVSVNEDGSPNTITCRWNHANGGNDNIMTPQQLEQIIGRSFYKTFLPYTEEELREAKNRLIEMGLYDFQYVFRERDLLEEIETGNLIPLFDTSAVDNNDEDESGMDEYEVMDMLCHDGIKYFAFGFNDSEDDWYGDDLKFIIVDNRGTLVINQLYDGVEYNSGVAYLSKNNKVTALQFFDGVPKYVNNQWYKEISGRTTYYMTVMNDDNLFNIVYLVNGKEILPEWVKSCEVHEIGKTNFAIILTQEGANIVVLDGCNYSIKFDTPRTLISICAGQFIKVVGGYQNQVVKDNDGFNRMPFEIYAFNLQKFPYLVYSCDGFYGGYYKVSTDKGYVFLEQGTQDGFKIAKVVPYEMVNNGLTKPLPPSYGFKRVDEKMSKNKTIIINEKISGQLNDLLAMTQFKFKSNIKKFLASLLEDPIGTEPEAIFTYNGLDKNKLIKALVDNKVITKKMTIDDHDEEGNPHTARMIVKYSVPKERFNERLDALYDVLFPDVVAKINEETNEATGCSSVGGGGVFGGEGESYEYDYPAFTKKGKKQKKKVGGDPYTLDEAYLKEYLDKDYMSPLKRMFNMSDEEKAEKSALWFARTRMLFKFIEQNTDFHDDCRKLIDGFDDLYDNRLHEALAERIAPLFKTSLRKYSKDFIDFVNTVSKDYSSDVSCEIPPFCMAKYLRDVQNEWLIHMSDHNESIHTSGFSYGVNRRDTNKDLMYKPTGYIDNKYSPGYNFAFDANDVDKVKSGMYGQHAILLQASGIKIHHYGDNEDQVIFYGPTARNLIFINHVRKNDGSEFWCIKSEITCKPLVVSKDLGKIVRWCIANFQQYRRHLVGNMNQRVRMERSRSHIEYNNPYGDVDVSRRGPYELDEAVTGDDGRKSSAVYAYAKNNKGEWCILAAKRNKNWDDEGGKMNPPMGHRHKYESPEDGAIRECEEESGIKFDKKDLVLASKEDWGTNFKIYLPGKTTDYKPGEGDEENTKFKWIPMSEISDYEWAWSCGKFAKRFAPKK